MPELSAINLEKPVREALREHAARGVIECFEPGSLRPLGSVRVTPPAEVREKVASARRAQESWRNTSFAERRRVLGIMLERLLAQADQLVEDVARDSGKTRHNAMVGEIWPVAEKLRWTIAHGEKHLVPEHVSSGLFVHKRAHIEFAPLGVVGVIAP